MKITIKIQSIEINVETDETTAAPAAIMTATVQSLEQAVAPLIIPHTNGKVVTPRKPRAAAPAPDTKVSEPPASDSTEPPATAKLNGHAARENAEESPKPEEPTTPTPEALKKRLPFEEFDKLVRSEMKRRSIFAPTRRAT